MEITYYGANCIKIVRKKVTIVIDDNLKMLGLKSPFKDPTIRIYSQKRFVGEEAEGFIIDGPGEYEVAGVSILGLASRAYTDHEDEKTATIYRLSTAGYMLGVMGHIHPQLNDEQLEKLGTIDILVIPVGDGGYTIDARAAGSLVRAIEPKIIIPTHYADKGINYEVPQNELEEFTQEMGITPEAVEALKISSTTILPEQLSAYQLQRLT
jgi:L-ascorbate metabolism protein UlaG (beta-lactamase superfamily)